MIRLIIVTIALFIMMAFFTRIEFPEQASGMPESLMALGFILIAAYLLGKLLLPLRLPKITGYLLAGIVAGPYVINLLSQPVVQNLQLINSIALSLIALTAGGEFRYQKIKYQLKTIGNAIFWQIIIVMAGFAFFVLIYYHHISFLRNQAATAALGVGLLLGALSIAKSPATTIAIITETGARGPFTNFVLGVTVFKDIIVVLIFSVVLSFSETLLLPDAHLQLQHTLVVFLEVVVSIVTGVFAGLIILLYLKYVGHLKTLFLLGFVLLGIELSAMLHLEVILVFMVAGFFIQNFSDLGSQLIDAIEGSSLPVYVIFFAIAGASLNFSLFLDNWLLVVFIVALRMLTTFQGTYLGGKLTHASKEVNRYGWMGFIGQAGLSLGLAALVKQNIPGTIGASINTLIIAAVALNQIIGPILFRFSLARVGEA